MGNKKMKRHTYTRRKKQKHNKIIMNTKSENISMTQKQT